MPAKKTEKIRVFSSGDMSPDRVEEMEASYAYWVGEVNPEIIERKVNIAWAPNGNALAMTIVAFYR